MPGTTKTWRRPCSDRWLRTDSATLGRLNMISGFVNTGYGEACFAAGRYRAGRKGSTITSSSPVPTGYAPEHPVRLDLVHERHPVLWLLPRSAGFSPQ